MNRTNLYNEVNAILLSRRKAAQDTARKAYALAREDKQFALADDKLRNITFLLAKAKAFDRDIDKLQKEYEEAKREYERALSRLNINIEPVYNCKHCNDSGENNGEICGCAKTLYSELLTKACNLNGIPPFNFSDNKAGDIACRQSDKLSKLYSTMQSYCDKFPSSDKKVILLLGQVGTGKTCVTAATANELIRKGYYVLYTSSFEFNNLMLKYRTSPMESKADIIESVTDADALFIDDLGSEPIFNNVTRELLFSVLDTRINSGKTTIITSNLNPEQLLNRYGERVYSRLTGKAHALVLTLNGDDLRYVNKK